MAGGLQGPLCLAISEAMGTRAFRDPPYEHLYMGAKQPCKLHGHLSKEICLHGCDLVQPSIGLKEHGWAKHMCVLWQAYLRALNDTNKSDAKM